jgi:pilus assembly protein CpaB
MRPSVIMLAVIAFVLAGAAAFLVKVFLERQAQPVVVQDEKPQGEAKILVASRTINPGEILEAKDVQWAEWPKSLIDERMIDENEFVMPSAEIPPTQIGMIVRPAEDGSTAKPGAEGEPAEGQAAGEGKIDGEGEKVADAEGGAGESAPRVEADSEVIGAVARRRIFANEPISPDQLIHRGDRGIGAAVVSPGMRAISIGISAQSASGGFIAPGDFVDVLLSAEIEVVDGKGKTLKGVAVEMPDGDSLLKYSTETVLRNMRVLAIDQSLGHSEDQGPADVGKTATLEVSPRDAEKLLNADQIGELTLVLRSLVVDASQDDADAFEDPFNFTTDMSTSRAYSALHTTSSLYGYGGSSGVRVNRGGTITQEGY